MEKCLDSLLCQTLHDIEVIAVDDCSTDGTLALLHQRAAADSRLRVLQTAQNSGQAVARNLALQQAAGELVCVVDADDWLSPDCLQQASDVFCRHPLTDCVVLRLMQHYEATGREVEYPLPPSLHTDGVMSGSDAFKLCIDGWKLHGLYVARAGLYKEYPFDTTTRLYSDDISTCLHYLHSREVRLCDGVYFYCKNSSSATNSFHFRRFDFMEAMLSQKLALKKENIGKQLMAMFEGQRWYCFLGIYRLYLQHRRDLTDEEQAQLRPRFNTILHTFRPSQLRWRYRWKPFYWLMTSLPMFDLSQRLYIRLRSR